VLPFSNTVSQREIKVYGANRVGLERRGFETAVVEALQTAFRLLTRSQLNTSQAIERIRVEVPETPEVNELIEFICASERGVIK
jgi:UDP-N-acetylglucosamine acyltransferase